MAAHLLKKILRILWTTNCHYRVYDSPPFVPVVCQINSMHILPSCFLDIDIVSSNLCPRIPGGLLPLGFHAKAVCAFSVHACHYVVSSIFPPEGYLLNRASAADNHAALSIISHPPSLLSTLFSKRITGGETFFPFF
jgi:hypothetical protein